MAIARTSEPALDLPPGFTAVALREHGDAYAHAMATAAEAGAGTLVWVGRFDLVEAAVVLEPEQPLAAARRVLFAGMNAAADALALHCPPEKPIEFGWPDTIMLDGGLIGGMRLGWPAGTAETDVPAWMVLGLMLRSTIHAGRQRWTAETRDRTSLEDEGFAVLSAADILASTSRHLMARVDRWLNDGFGEIGRDYLGRLSQEKGTRRGIDVNGDLLVHRLAGQAPAERRSLVEGLEACAWLDRATGEPLL